ncbi:MAG: glycoside hydrolase family 3 C-terminal domain-containing protein [Atopobiaceae bacterium]|nr:glycoside hydrolase family 3 C-terminal domain-containing protein [Atopobiaceae bacterium]
MAQLTRRNFVQVAAATGAAAALAACGNNNAAPADSGEDQEGEAPAASGSLEAPDASAYPIDPDGSEHLGTQEEIRDGWVKITNPGTDLELGVMDAAKIIVVDGLAFKDMNGNGKLDLYEDWRQPIEARATALAAMMSAEEIIPLMWHGGATDNSQLSTDTSSFGLCEKGSRAGVSRLRSKLESYATDVQWINNVQAVCENSAYGIPYINSSDPYPLFDVPAGCAIAATMDKDLWRQAGMWQARAWRATGVRCELGPQIDVYTQPRGTRLSGAVSEDPALNRDFAAAFGGGMQSTWGDDEATDDLGWGKDSVGVMLKHYAGEGCSEGGRDDHSDMGKWNVFPGGNYEAHLIPFLDGGLHLDSKTEQMAAVMPCYGIAVDPDHDEEYGEYVGSAYNKRQMGILRNTGWDGMVTTDWVILDYIAHGVKNLSEPERFKKLITNTVDQHGGSFQPEIGMEAYQLLVDEVGEDEALATIRDSARRIFAFMHKVQLFDNPYCDRTIARAILESEAAAAFGMSLAEKSVIMLKNDGTISSAGLDGKVYVPQKVENGATALCFTGDLGGLEVVTDAVGDPTGEPAEEGGDPTFQESDVTRLTADELADVKYAVIEVSNPADAYQGVEGGAGFMQLYRGQTEFDDPVWHPITLQYRPYTADGANVRKESLNPEDEFGVYENRSYYGQSTFATNENELDLVLSVRAALPADAKLILVIKADRPMVFSEIEPSADAILFGMVDGHGGLTDEAFAHIITGAVEPSGLLTHQMPKDMDTVEASFEDTPRDVECYTDANGNIYDFCFGLNWSGVIDDERVATYKVAPLTKCETPVNAD